MDTREAKKIKNQDIEVLRAINGIEDLGYSERKNLALNRPVSESSHIEDGGGKFYCKYVTDGDRRHYRWISTHGDMDPTLEIELEQVSEIDEIRIYSGNNQGTISFISEVKIYADGKFALENKNINRHESINKVNVKAKKFTFKFPSGVNRIYQIEIYGRYQSIKENVIWTSIRSRTMNVQPKPTGDNPNYRVFLESIDFEENECRELRILFNPKTFEVYSGTDFTLDGFTSVLSEEDGSGYMYWQIERTLEVIKNNEKDHRIDKYEYNPSKGYLHIKLLDSYYFRSVRCILSEDNNKGSKRDYISNMTELEFYKMYESLNLKMEIIEG